MQNSLVRTSLKRNHSIVSSSVASLLTANKISVLEEDFKQDFNEPLVTHLRKRGLMETCVNEDILLNLGNSKKLGLYCGADPTAKSLHLGNLLPLMVLVHFNLRGHSIFPLIGGATGAVGDPSGRSTERDIMAQKTRLDHVDRISNQFINFFKSAIEYGKSRNSYISELDIGTQELQNNYSWWKDMGMLKFLAIFGKHIRVNQMLSRESIKNRLQSDQGIGFNEFTYQILQAYDFYYLNKNVNVDIQVGGNDQYGNIVAGIDLITRMRKAEDNSKTDPVFGITVPLLTTSNGVKFGKSAGNAIFIDKQLTPSYDIYQFMYNTTDDDIQKFLYKFSLLPTPVIDKVVNVHNSDKKSRLGQRLLAFEMCDLIHGDGEGYNNFIVSEVLFSKENIRDTFTGDQIISAFKSQNMITNIPYEELKTSSVVNIIYKCSNGAKSKSELRRMIKSGSISIGNTKEFKITDGEAVIDLKKHLIDEKVLLIRVGKQFHVIETSL